MFTHLLKFLIALALVPFVFAEVWTLVDLVRNSMPNDWGTPWFVSFGAGFLVWVVIFCFLPRTMWLYVLGHELTHALAAMMAGGKVSAFKVTSKGGYVMTDRVNWWITLSPYFIPIYALIWMALWLTINFYYPLNSWLPLLYFGLGLFWAFHLTFTLSMIHLRQTDLSREGYFFPAVIIPLMNFLAMLLLLGLISHGGLKSAGLLLLERTEQSYEWTGAETVRGWNWALEEWRKNQSHPAG